MDLVGLRGVLEQLHEVVAVDHLARGGGQVAAELERRWCRPGAGALVVAHVVGEVATARDQLSARPVSNMRLSAAGFVGRKFVGASASPSSETANWAFWRVAGSSSPVSTSSTSSCVVADQARCQPTNHGLACHARSANRRSGDAGRDRPMVASPTSLTPVSSRAPQRPKAPATWPGLRSAAVAALPIADPKSTGSASASSPDSGARTSPIRRPASAAECPQASSQGPCRGPSAWRASARSAAVMPVSR